MYTLEINGRPIAVVNLPRHEAQDFFDDALAVRASERRLGLDTSRIATRRASHHEKKRLVQSFKERHELGLVKSHQFDGFYEDL